MAATVARANDGHPEDVVKQAAAEASTDRFTHPQEVADLVLLLASDRPGNVTGTDVLIDGGVGQDRVTCLGAGDYRRHKVQGQGHPGGVALLGEAPTVGDDGFRWPRPKGFDRSRISSRIGGGLL